MSKQSQAIRKFIHPCGNSKIANKGNQPTPEQKAQNARRQVIEEAQAERKLREELNEVWV